MTGNVDLYRALHNAEASYGTTANRLTPYILPFAREVAPKRILDYGCGKSQICNELAARLGAEPVKYDPAIPALSARPEGQCDFAINNDVLEHIPEEQLDAIIAEIRSFAPKAVFTISVALADAILENGENAHCTVRPPEWWQARLTKHYGEAHRVPTFVDTACAFATWKPSAEAVREVEALDRRVTMQQRTNRRFSRLKNAFRLAVKPPLSRDDLLAKLDGKSVALVGNAHSLSEKELGAAIDAHDVVVRFNGALIPHIRSHGRRTDWVATGIPFTAGTARSRGVNTVLWLPPNRKNLSAWMVRRKDADLYLHAPERYEALGQEIGAERPSCGATMIDLVMSNPNVKKVSLYGFDFFATRSYSGDHTAQSTPHNFGNERAFVEKLMARDSRLTLN
jgi:hypothetical protein